MEPSFLTPCNPSVDTVVLFNVSVHRDLAGSDNLSVSFFGRTVPRSMDYTSLPYQRNLDRRYPVGEWKSLLRYFSAAAMDPHTFLPHHVAKDRKSLLELPWYYQGMLIPDRDPEALERMMEVYEEVSLLRSTFRIRYDSSGGVYRCGHFTFPPTFSYPETLRETIEQHVEFLAKRKEYNTLRGVLRRINV